MNQPILSVVLPAYNAGRTLRRTWEEIVSLGIVDSIILVDDKSLDNTVEVARSLDGLLVHGSSSRNCHFMRIRTIWSSTTRCWARPGGALRNGAQKRGRFGLVSAKMPMRKELKKKLHLAIDGG